MTFGSPEIRADASLWYGSVPSDWNVERFKHVVTIRNGQVNPEDDRYKDLPLFAPNHIESGTGRLLGVESADAQGAESGKYFVEAGEVVYSKIRPALRKVIVAPVTGLCSADMYPVKPTSRMHSRFLFYAMLGDGFSKYTLLESDRVAMPKINREALGECILVHPEREEQVRIASFLDRKTAAIDALIAKKERLMELLQEKRQALITQVVTKGLDPRVPMKDSGVSWFGEVPAHWEVHQLRRVVARFIDYRGRTPTKVDDGVPLITAGAIRDGRIDHARAPDYMLREEYGEFMRRGLPELGDVVFTTEAPLGEVAQVTDTSVAFAQRIILFKVNRERMTGDFLWLYYCADAGRCEVVSRASGSTAEGIRADRLRGSLVLVPPLVEQVSIVARVRRELARLEPIGAVVESQLSKLREYRQALITAAVTGKIDLSEEAA